jgi:4a-hydroxytetrahydrobiopterin dehydratase
METRLTSPEINTATSHLPNWKVVADRLEQEFFFHSFAEAFSFMTRIALEAEKAGHHPQFLQTNNRVKVVLTTHSAGGITLKDINLAQWIDKINWT